MQEKPALTLFVHHERQAIGRWVWSEYNINSYAEAIVKRLVIEKLGLNSDNGIDELSMHCILTVSTQPINITMPNDNGNYQLQVA